MNYYKRHIGDYAKKAGHLSVMEHGVYTLLLDAYYDREQAPTRAEAVRISRCRTPDELAALDAVLADFFMVVDGRYVQERVEEEFVKAAEQAKTNQANGKLGGRPRKPKGNRVKTGSVLTGNQIENEKNPNPLIHQSTKKDQELSEPNGSGASPVGEAPKKSDPIPYQAIVDAYNGNMQGLAKVRTLSPKRRTLIRRVWQTSPEFRSAEFFRDRYFPECAENNFLNGTGPYRNGHENWRPDFDYLLRPDVVTRVYERALDAVERGDL